MSPGRSRIRSKPAGTTTVVGGGSGDSGINDAFSLGIRTTDSSVAPADAGTFRLNLTQSDSNAAQTETSKLSVSGYAESSTAPTDSQSFAVRVWLSASAGTGVTSPANADGQNDGTLATVQTAAAGPTTETLTSTCGASIGTVSFTTAIYRGWYRLQTVLSTSTAQVVLHSTTAAFADKIVETLAAINGDTNRLTTPFVYDLVANGIDTLAKLQSVQVLHRTTDVAAGVQPATVTADAGAIELAGVF